MVTIITIFDGFQKVEVKINLKYRWVAPFTIEDNMLLESLVGYTCFVATVPDVQCVLYKSLEGKLKIMPDHALIEMGIDVYDFRKMAHNPIDIDVALTISRL